MKIQHEVKDGDAIPEVIFTLRKCPPQVKLGIHVRILDNTASQIQSFINPLHMGIATQC